MIKQLTIYPAKILAGILAGFLSLFVQNLLPLFITVTVFVPFMILFMGERWRWDYLWAFLCMVGAVYFVNRAKL